MRQFELRVDLCGPGVYPIYETTDAAMVNSIVVYRDFDLAQTIVKLLNNNLDSNKD